MKEGIRVLAAPPTGSESILSADALAFLERLHRQFQPVRLGLLKRRAERQAEFDAGALPAFLPETESIRTGAWKVANTPAELEKRWVEILDGLVEKAEFTEFLTLPAYAYLE